MKCKGFYHCLVSVGEWLQPFFLLAIRIFWGYMFFETGRGKFADIGSVSSYFASLGIAWPIFNAYLVATVECIGGLCLLFGFASRLVCIPLIIVMLTALSFADHAALMSVFETPTKLLAANPFTFLMAALTIFIFGPGKFSIDALFEKFCCKK